MEEGKTSIISDTICEEEVNILHLSDLHFEIEKSDKKVYKINEKRQEKVIKSLIDTLKDDLRVPVDWKPDVVVISGDIGWTGNIVEYKKYEKIFLEPLLKGFSNLSPKK